jgi:hypothetical protein
MHLEETTGIVIITTDITEGIMHSIKNISKKIIKKIT